MFYKFHLRMWHLFALLIALSPLSAMSAEYYVSSNGSDTNSGAIDSPWRTINQAANTLVAGDTVFIRGGIYNEYVTIRRSGTSSQPITYKAYDGESPVIEIGGEFGGIWITGSTNIVIDGLTVRNTVTSGQGGGVSIFENGNESGTITIKNCNLYNNNSPDNPAGVYIKQALGTIIIQNNIIHDNNHLSLSPGVHHGNGVLVFGTIGSSAYSNIIVANNDIYNQGVAVKYKHPTGSNGSFDVRYNRIHDIPGRAAIETVQNGTRIHHNVVFNVLANESAAIRLGADFNVDRAEVFNNTVYNVGWGVYVQAGSSNNHIHDNILYTIPRSGINGYGMFISDTNTTTSDNNLFFNGTPANWGGYGGGIPYSLADLRSEGLDLNSDQGDPQFMNAPNDFRLNSGSAANNLGSTGLSVGAYQNGDEVVGLLSSIGIVKPSPPTLISLN